MDVNQFFIPLGLLVVLSERLEQYLWYKRNKQKKQKSDTCTIQGERDAGCHYGNCIREQFNSLDNTSTGILIKDSVPD